MRLDISGEIARMTVTSAWIYPLLMGAFGVEAAALCRVLPESWIPAASTESQERLSGIDGLRGLLALSVFLHHAVSYYDQEVSGIWSDTPSNFYAQLGVMPVTLFLFITAYLFWSRIMRRQTLRPIQFWSGRLGRLGPAYWAATILFFVVVAFLSDFHRQVPTSLLLVQGFGWLSFLGAGHDINGIPGSLTIFGQVWTLRLEWLFYLSLPFLAWFSRSRKRLLLLIAASWVFGVAAQQIASCGIANFGWKFAWKTMGDFSEFLATTFSIGMLAATLPAGTQLGKLLRSGVITIIAIALISVTAFWVPARYGWVESLMLALPFLSICMGNTWGGLLSHRSMRLLGQISYSIYLVHSLVFRIGLIALRPFASVPAMGPLRFWIFAWICGAVTVCLSCFWWRYLEAPFLKGFNVAPTRDAPADWRSATNEAIKTPS